MIISIWSAKGGVGVSTLSLGLAKAMQKDDPVLMDFNLFSPTLAAMLGLEGTYHGLDRILLHSDGTSIERSLEENWVQHESISLLPGVQYPPGYEYSGERLVKTLKEFLDGQTAIVDAGSGIVHPIQKEMLLRADVILVVVTPYLMTYHNLWRMWQNDFFIPYQQTKKAGVIVNQFHGSVKPKDIATLMDLWLAGDLPIVKGMTQAINQGNISEAFQKSFLKKLKIIGDSAVDRMKQTNKVVKQLEASQEWMLPEKSNERREWSFET